MDGGAQGTVKLMPSLTPLRLLVCRATGMVAALDMVPSGGEVGGQHVLMSMTGGAP